MEPGSYIVKRRISLDTILYFLINPDQEVIDSVSFQNDVGIREDLLAQFNFDRNVEGWSCLYQKEIMQYNRILDSLDHSIQIEERFLERIISNEGLKKGDEKLLISFWEEVNGRNFISSLDPEWSDLQRDYFESLVLRYDSTRIHAFNFDKCEKDEFLRLRKELEGRPRDGIYYISLKINIGQKTTINSNIYFNPLYKKLKIQYGATGEIGLNISCPLKRFR